MAIAHHDPQQYVCMECQVMHAGIPYRGKGDTIHYDPPTRCSACGETDLVLSTKYPHLVTQGVGP